MPCMQGRARARVAAISIDGDNNQTANEHRHPDVQVTRGTWSGGGCSGGKQQSIKEFFKRGVCNLKEILAVCALA